MRKTSAMAAVLCVLLASGQAASAKEVVNSYDPRDPGASGVVDGSDVYQFLNSGSIIDPVRMEEASRRFDRAIKLPNRIRQARSWDEVYGRKDSTQTALNAGMPTAQTQVVTKSGGGASATGSSSSASAGSSSASATNQTTATTSSSGQTAQANKGHFFKKMENAFLRTFEIVGFPISDEFLPGDVDASLAGDLPDSPDRRVYVHEVPDDEAADDSGKKGEKVSVTTATDTDTTKNSENATKD